MALDTPSQVKEILTKYSLRPIHGRGQNFLVDKNIIYKIVEAAALGSGEHVLEIGPGLGALTDALAARARKVLAVEIDKNLISILNEEYVWDNVEILNSDILKVPNPEICQHLGSESYRLIANLPYQITSEVIEKFLTTDPKPEEIIIMVQQEVGERMMARSPRANLLALMVEFYCEPKKLFKVGRNSFYPAPKVDSVIMRLTPKRELALMPEKIKEFWPLVRSGYRSKRKFLINNLANYSGNSKPELESAWQDLGWNPKTRAESIKLEDWLKLFQKLGL